MVKLLKKERPEYADSTISYAGRLDPMAEGVLILLVDEENKKREKYQGLDKEYIFEVLFGLETDTYDLLGIVNQIFNYQFSIFKEEKTIKYIKNLVGKQTQTYPPYSSYQIDGKPLFQWAKEGKIDAIELPEKEIVIFESEYLGKKTITAEELHQTIIERVSKVDGKFRQKEILKRWRMSFKNLKGPNSPSDLSEHPLTQSFTILKFRIVCSSGTYVRQIAHKSGKVAGTGALCYHIKRTRVGKYRIENSIIFARPS